MLSKGQHTIRFHVDDVLSSHLNSKVNDEFAKWAQEKYGALKPVKVTRGKTHEFLGMTLDFSVKGECHVRQERHVSDIISNWPRILEQSNKKALTPAPKTLFEKGEGLLLNSEKKEMFHSTVAKGLFVGCRSRPDICPTISVLSSRVRDPNMNDWAKCDRLVR